MSAGNKSLYADSIGVVEDPCYRAIKLCIGSFDHGSDGVQAPRFRASRHMEVGDDRLKGMSLLPGEGRETLIQGSTILPHAMDIAPCMNRLSLTELVVLILRRSPYTTLPPRLDAHECYSKPLGCAATNLKHG